MFKRKGEPAQPYIIDKIINWLVWLAQGMEQHSQAIFLIEELDAGWLLTRTELWCYRVISCLIICLIFGSTGVFLLPLLFLLSGGMSGEKVGGMAFNMLFWGIKLGFDDTNKGPVKQRVLRLFLFFKGYAPLNYSRFLDYATRLIILRKVGQGYIFIHRFLQNIYQCLYRQTNPRNFSRILSRSRRMSLKARLISIGKKYRLIFFDCHAYIASSGKNIMVACHLLINPAPLRGSSWRLPIKTIDDGSTPFGLIIVVCWLREFPPAWEQFYLGQMLPWLNVRTQWPGKTKQQR